MRFLGMGVAVAACGRPLERQRLEAKRTSLVVVVRPDRVMEVPAKSRSGRARHPIGPHWCVGHGLFPVATIKAVTETSVIASQKVGRGPLSPW